MTDAKPQLPQLYTMAEVCSATGYDKTTIWRALKNHAEIRPVGKGRGLRFTLQDYMALVEALRSCRSNSSHPENGRTTGSSSSGGGSRGSTRY